MSLLNLDELLSQSMATVEAAPNYVDLETGVYILEVVEAKADKRKTKDEAKAKAEGKPLEYVQLTHQYKVVAVLQTEADKLPIAAGSLCSDQWGLNENGLPYFKTRTADIAAAAGEDRETIDGLSIKECLDAVKGAQFKCSAKKVTRQDDKGVERTNVRIENICAAD